MNTNLDHLNDLLFKSIIFVIRWSITILTQLIMVIRLNTFIAIYLNKFILLISKLLDLIWLWNKLKNSFKLSASRSLDDAFHLFNIFNSWNFLNFSSKNIFGVIFLHILFRLIIDNIFRGVALEWFPKLLWFWYN